MESSACCSAPGSSACKVGTPSVSRAGSTIYLNGQVCRAAGTASSTMTDPVAAPTSALVATTTAKVNNPKPGKTCKDSKQKWCARRLTDHKKDSKKRTARLCKRSTYQAKCQQTCGLCE